MKLGFIALSGLRLCDAPLLELGLSFPDVRKRATDIQALPSLGLLTLAGMTPEEFDIEYPRFTVQTQRGCPLSCEFCAASMRLSPKFRVKPVERVIAEVRRLKELFRRPFIEFADDNTFADKAHGKRLMRALEPENVRWFTETDVSVADDDELLGLMRRAGCQQVLIGFESPRADKLDGVEQKSNWKSRRADRYLSAIETIQKHGITVNGFFIVGLDGDGPECFAEIYEFVKSSGLYDVQVTILTPFPGTPLWQRFKEEGRLLDETASERATLFDINFQPAGMSVEELRTGFFDLVARLYHPDFVAHREKMFRAQMRAGVAERRLRVHGKDL